MQIKPPPEGLSEWVQLIAIQLAAAGGLVIAGWKLVTRPFRKRLALMDKRTKRLRKAFKRESFALRTKATTIMGMAVDNQHEIEGIRSRLTHFEERMMECFTELRGDMKKSLEATEELKDRLIAVETEVRLNRNSGGDS